MTPHLIFIDPDALMRNLGILGAVFQTISIAMGVGLFMMGIFRLKRYGEMRTFMSYQMTIARPLLMILAGILLICLPVTLSTALFAFWSDSNPLPYTTSHLTGYEVLIPPIIIFVRLLGVGAFIKGVLLLSRCGSEQSNPGTMGKSITYIFVGILCVHILGTIDLLKSFFGIT